MPDDDDDSNDISMVPSRGTELSLLSRTPSAASGLCGLSAAHLCKPGMNSHSDCTSLISHTKSTNQYKIDQSINIYSIAYSEMDSNAQQYNIELVQTENKTASNKKKCCF